VIRNLYGSVREFTIQMKRRNISAHAASTAFFFFLSLVPMLIVVCTVIPYTPLTEEHLLEAVTDITPPQLDGLAAGLISNVYDKSAGILSVAIIATIWSAGKGVMALMQGLNAVNDVEEHRNYFVIRGVASFYTLVMLLVLVLSLFVMVFGEQLVILVWHRIPQLKRLISLILNFRFLFVWGILILLFAGIYAYVPDRKQRFKEQIPGAVFSAVGWSILSWGISMYLYYGNPYGIYGSLSVIIVVLLWMYFCMYIILVGAYLNKNLDTVEIVTAKISHPFQMI